MRTKVNATGIRVFLIVTIFATIGALTSSAASRGFEYSFQNMSDGEYPSSGLIADSSGNLFGVTSIGGNFACSCGTVFKLSHNASGVWNKTEIYKFTGKADGGTPQGNLVFDLKGNLYGTANEGGIDGNGVVFELVPNSQGDWTENTLHSFTGGDDGIAPASGVIFDAAGNLYGTTEEGGTGGEGIIFKLSESQSGSWTENVLYDFPIQQKQVQPGALAIDKTGNLYGTTVLGGSNGWGSVFKLTMNQDGIWTEQDIYAFDDGPDGAQPTGPLAFDEIGNIYGVAALGGSLVCAEEGCGVIFELTPNAGGWRFKVIHTFDGLDGSTGRFPQGGLVFDSAGVLYGVTTGGGSSSCQCGTIFRLTNTRKFNLLAVFDGTHGSYPSAGVSLGAPSAIIGTTNQGGAHGFGLAFQLNVTTRNAAIVP